MKQRVRGLESLSGVMAFLQGRYCFYLHPGYRQKQRSSVLVVFPVLCTMTVRSSTVEAKEEELAGQLAVSLSPQVDSALWRPHHPFDLPRSPGRARALCISPEKFLQMAIYGNPGSILMSPRMCSLSLEHCWAGNFTCCTPPYFGQRLSSSAI